MQGTYNSLLLQLAGCSSLAELGMFVSGLTLNVELHESLTRDVKCALVSDFQDYEASANRDEKRTFALANTPFHVIPDMIIAFALSYLTFDMVATTSGISKKFNGMYTIFGILPRYFFQQTSFESTRH